MTIDDRLEDLIIKLDRLHRRYVLSDGGAATCDMLAELAKIVAEMRKAQKIF